MDHGFWHRRWQKNEIGFHEARPNELLIDNLNALKLTANSRIFVPLCGKTLDIGWLMRQGHDVVGVELSSKAVDELFESLKITPVKSTLNSGLICYESPQLTVYQGDIFNLTAEQLEPVDAVYDRAALVALPDDLRLKYSRHLLEISHATKQLLIVFDYDQSQLSGPPFSINKAEIERHYNNTYVIKLLHCREVDGGLKGSCFATESSWLLLPKTQEKMFDAIQ